MLLLMVDRIQELSTDLDCLEMGRHMRIEREG
jgi:hypothetical protein